MSKTILRFLLVVLSLTAAFFCWFSINEAIVVPGSSVWLVPMLWLAFFYIVYSLEFVIVQEKFWSILSIAVGFLLSLIFVHSLWHLVVLLFASGLLYIAYIQIRKDLEMNVKLCLPKTLRMGKAAFMLALALAISSQYYFQAKEAGLLKLPVFDAGMILDNQWAKGMLYKLNPDLQKLEDKNLTVDELTLQNFSDSQMGSDEAQLLDMAQSSQAVSPANLQKMQALQKQKVLEAGREQLGKMAGKTLTGSEKVADVVKDSINLKIQGLVSPEFSSGNYPAVSIGMAAILFLTVLSLGAFLIRILVHLISLIFLILISTKVVRIKKVPVEMEVIE